MSKKKDKEKKQGKKKQRETRRKLKPEQLDELAKTIGYKVLENLEGASNLMNVIRKGDKVLEATCIRRADCEEGNKDYFCNVFGAFNCTVENKEFSCGVDGKEFKCEGGMFDFECHKKFDCGATCGPFNCIVSFDDEDCEKKFSCDKDHFDCDSKKEYNT